MSTFADQKAVVKLLSDNTEWPRRVDKMPEKQVQAIYLRLKPTVRARLTEKVERNRGNISIYMP